MGRTSRVVDGVDDDDVEDVDFCVEKEDKTDDEEDRDNGKGVGSYRNASEKVCECTLVRYRSCCILTLTQNRIYLLTLVATVAVFVIVKIIVVVIYV